MNIQQLLATVLMFAVSGLSPLFSQDNALVLHDATPVRMRINRNLSSADARIGETVDFEVLDEVKIGDTLVIARGATAIATVTEAQSKRRMGRGGKLDVNIDYVRTVNGDKIVLRAVKEMKGGGHTGAMTGAIVATSLIFWPAAPFFLFIHGKDISIPKGTEITAYTNGEIKLDPVTSVAKPVAPIPAAPVQLLPASVTPTSTSARATPALTSPTPASVPTPSTTLIGSAPVQLALPAANGSPSAPEGSKSANTRRLPNEDAAATVMLPGADPKLLVNADIIALKQAGFGDSLIIAKIKASRGHYKLDINDLLALKKANISEPVISAMIEASKR